MKENRRTRWFSKFETREDALQLVKGAAMGFFIVATLEGALSFALGFATLVDVAIYAIGGYLFLRFHSRVDAVTLLVFALVATVVSVENKLGGTLGGGSNVWLGIVFLWVAIRATEATFKLHGRFSQKAETI
jgi:hypothetical protein